MAFGALELPVKSLKFDFEFLKIKKLPLSRRFIFLLQKNLALLKIVFLKQSGNIKLNNIRFSADNISALGTFQSCIVDFYNDIVRPNIINVSKPNVIDVGANVGQFCNAVKLFYPKAKIVSFEPDPNIFEILKANTANLDDVVLINHGLADSKAKLLFHKNKLSGKSSFSKKSKDTYETITLPVTTLDSHRLFGNKKIDLVKIDVEGFEYNVIKGAIKTLKHSEYLLVEISLRREQHSKTNTDLISTLSTSLPGTHIVRTARPLGDPVHPSCEDFLFRLSKVSV